MLSVTYGQGILCEVPVNGILMTALTLITVGVNTHFTETFSLFIEEQCQGSRKGQQVIVILLIVVVIDSTTGCLCLPHDCYFKVYIKERETERT